jgi:protein phosphatase
MNIGIPELSLVVLIGPSGAGKSTFARKHFLPTEIISSDYCRGLVADNENDQAATGPAFEVLQFIAGKRLQGGRLTVIDATNVQMEARKPLVALARQYHCIPVALVLDIPEKLCRERNASRPDRDFGDHVIRNQRSQLHRSLRSLEREGFRHVHVFRSSDELTDITITRQPLWNNKKDVVGSFDIVGDIHGCYTETTQLLEKLGYRITRSDGEYVADHPEGRKAVFLGDLVDRGPNTPEVLRLVMGMVKGGSAFCVAGNHDVKLVRALRGKDVKKTHGLAESLDQLSREPEEFRKKAADFLDKLVSHYVFDKGNLVAAHAGLREEMHGRGSGQVRSFAMYGETTGETDEFGLPVRYNWAAEYRGRATVVYGHTPVPQPEWLNNTICIDTGCVFGGKLSALRYPEKEIVSVPAQARYYEPARPLVEETTERLSAQHAADDVLDLADVTGKRIVHTELHRTITIREENATAALEVMSRFAANPKWLIYLPPTMSPSETSAEPGLLEHPAEAFSYYRTNGETQVVCEAKHMGSRAVVIVCRDEDAARTRFGIEHEGGGIVYTRTGRRFFVDGAMEHGVIDRVRRALDSTKFWDEFRSDWFCLDCELMPWSVKAQELLRSQYAAVGSAARAFLSESLKAVSAAKEAGVAVAHLPELYAEKANLADRYVEAYRRYSWNVSNVADLRLAPFHLLASEGQTHVGKTHAWHMETLHRLVAADPNWLVATPYRAVDVTKEDDVRSAIDWWTAFTEAGGEGMVVKPLNFVSRGKRGILQPGIKCRGREYLRIIYGLDYTLPENLTRLRERGLATKRSLALREFALGVEGLERFIKKEPLRRIHECVFGVLALESEPVDPRL